MWNANALAISRAGHDKDELYVVIEEKDNFCCLCDGKRRTLENPKRKKTIHLQKIIHLQKQMLEAMSQIETDADIRRILKEYKKENRMYNE